MKTKWINVNDRLPKSGDSYISEQVLTITETGRMSVLHWDKEFSKWSGINSIHLKITHWSSLPEPPTS